MFSLAMAIGLMMTLSMTAYADDFVTYLDENGDIHNCTKYIQVTENDTIWGTEGSETADWYVVDGEVKNKNLITVKNNVNLILCDGAKLDVKGIICKTVTGDNKKEYDISIYAQSKGMNEGKLIATGDNSNDDGIYARNITINGGNVSAETKVAEKSAINADNELTITGGEVKANGTENGLYANNGVTVSGGIVNATGDYGIYVESGGVSINDGSVTATGNELGIYVESDVESGGVSINGGSVTATGNVNGIYSQFGNIKVANGEVKATAYGIETDADSYPSGIEADYDVIIRGGKVTAYGSENGILSDQGSVTINGGKTRAIGGSDGIWANEVTIDGGNVTAVGKQGSGVCAEDEVVNVAEESGFIAVGKELAIADYDYDIEEYIPGTVKNAITGTGWTDVEGTQGKQRIKVSGENGQTLEYKKVRFPEAPVPAASQKVVLKSVKAKNGRKAVAKWKKNSAVDGYQLVYSTSKKFTKKTTKKADIKSYKTVKKTVKKLKKGKKYYFKLRTYTKVEDISTEQMRNVYGKWSKVKKIKAK